MIKYDDIDKAQKVVDEKFVGAVAKRTSRDVVTWFYKEKPVAKLEDVDNVPNFSFLR